jgi:DNA-binding MarR family transcriptional regulator
MSESDGDLIARATEIRVLTLIISKLAMRDLEERLHASGSQISPLQFGIMRVLNAKRHTLSDLGRQMMLTPASLVPVIDSLEDSGIVRREIDPADRRRTPLVLTEHGAKVLDHALRFDNAETLIQGLRKLGPEKAAQIVSLLRELVMHISGSNELLDRLNAVVMRHGLPCNVPHQGQQEVSRRSRERRRGRERRETHGERHNTHRQERVAAQMRRIHRHKRDGD